MHTDRSLAPRSPALIAIAVLALYATGPTTLVARAGEAASPSASPAASATTSGGGDVAGASFLPDDTVMYLELRGDLPAGQGDALTDVIARFPGFSSTAGFEAEADLALEMMVAQATGGALSWSEDVRSWFGGQGSVGLLGGYGSLVTGDPSVLVGLEVTDREAAEALADRVVEMAVDDSPGALTEETYRGTTIVGVADDAFAYAVTDDLLLLGTGSDEVRTGLDVRAGAAPSLASDDRFRAAFARVPDARLAAVYADLAALRPTLEAAMLLSSDPSIEAWDGLLDYLPLDLTFYLAARPDGAILQGFATPGPGMPMIGTGEPHLAEAFPSGTQVLVEIPDVGRTIAWSADSMADLGPGLDADALEVLAWSLDNLLGWVGDVAVGAGIDGSGVWAGVVIETSEPGAAGVYVGVVQAILAAASLAMASDPYASGSPFTVRATTIDGADVTTVSFDAEDVQAFALPFEPSVSIAQDGERVIVGTASYVATALELEPEDSLATDERYVDTLATASSPNAGHLYVDIRGIREVLGPVLAQTVPDYERVAAYLEPFDRAALAYEVAPDGVMSVTLLLLLR